MKKLRVGLSFIVLVALISIGFTEKTYAAACSPSADYGSASYTIPTLPATGEYTIWSRINVPDTTNNSYFVEIAQGSTKTCYKIGDSSAITPNTWKWINYQNGSTTSAAKFTFTATTGYTMRLVGAEPNVKLDKVMFISDSCVPKDSGFGDDCGNSVTTSPNPSTPTGSSGGTVTVPPPTEGPVRGKVNTSPTVAGNADQVAKVQYFSNGKELQSSNSAIPFDTTLLSNGKHEVEARVTLKDGSVVTEETTLDINNPQNIFSPVKRWIRINQRPVTIGSIATGVISLAGAGFFTTRYFYLHNRYLKFHGF